MKPSLLFITGWAHEPKTLQPMADKLVADYKVQIRTATQILNEHHIPDTDYIIAHSMGGLLAVELFPECCKKLVLISSTAKFCAGEDYLCGTPEKILRHMIRQLRRNPEAVLEEFFKNVHFPHKPSGRGFSGACDREPSSALNDLVAGLEYLLASDVRKRIPTLEIPVLLLHGTADRIITATAAEWLHAHLPSSELKIFENGGHALPAHHFDETIDEISRFL